MANPTEDDLRVAKAVLVETGMIANIPLADDSPQARAVGRIASAIAAEREKVWQQAIDVIDEILICNRGAFTLANYIKDGFYKVKAGDKE